MATWPAVGRAAHAYGGIVVWSEPGKPTDDAVVVMRLDQFQELYGPLVGGEDER